MEDPRAQSGAATATNGHAEGIDRPKSSIHLGRLEPDSKIFHGEDQENVALTLNAVKRADGNGDGRLDMEEVGTMVLKAVKAAKKASKKEKKFKFIIGGLGGFLVIFALIFLAVQGVSLSQSIEESKITSINEDAYGNARLQDASGADLSTRSFGDKIEVESRLDIYSGRMLHCTSVSNVAAMTNDATNGVDARVVAMSPGGLPAAGFSLQGGFVDEQDGLSFGDGTVRVDMTSDACDTATATPDDDEGNASDATGGGDVFDRQLALRGANKELAAPPRVLARHREMYAAAMIAHREGRTLTEDGQLSVELPPWDEDKCDVKPTDAQAVKDSTDGIACPVMRFLVRKGLQDGLFDLCGYGQDSYMVDANSMKRLLSTGISRNGNSFTGLQRHKVMSNDAGLSVMDRAFAGAIHAQSTGVLTHNDSTKCLNIKDYLYQDDISLLPATSSNINLGSSCSGIRMRWKLQASPDDSSIKIHHRRSMAFCMSRDASNSGVELVSCGTAGGRAKWTLDSSGRIGEWGGEKCLSVDGSDNVFMENCSDQSSAQVWSPPPILNAAHLENNFDHSASSGIIGAATLNADDNAVFNRGKYEEFLSKLCDCDDTSSIPDDQVFNEIDVGRAVNHFGQVISNPTVMASTKVGPFSWAILTFEWSNLFVAFKKDGALPYSTFKALFLTDADLITEGLLDAASISTRFVPDIERDEIGTDDVHSLSSTIAAMNIQMTGDVKAAMDAAVAAWDCDSDPSDSVCAFHGLFTDLCGEGYGSCLEGSN